MTAGLVLFEDRRVRDLEPLTDVLPVPALAFGASCLGRRLVAAARLPLLAIEARADVLAAWEDAPAPAATRPGAGDEVVAVNAAALPGAWLAALIARPGPVVLEHEGRIVGARLRYGDLAPGLGRGAGFEGFLAERATTRTACECSFVEWPWTLIEWNAKAIAADLDGQAPRIEGTVHPLAARLEPSRIAIGADAVVEPFAVLDARAGPIRIGARALVRAHTVVTGPCVVGEGTQLLGGFVSRSTIGPECRIAGEVEDTLWQGYANKRHHGFIGHSVIGEWVNLGALTTTSDLKNNYGHVRVWVDGREVDTGSPKVGALIGAHVKTGIGTLLPTGASIGVGSNLFGGGRFAPRQVPAFGWWDGSTLAQHRFEKFLETAAIAMSRRGRSLTPGVQRALEAARDRAAPRTA